MSFAVTVLLGAASVVLRASFAGLGTMWASGSLGGSDAVASLELLNTALPALMAAAAGWCTFTVVREGVGTRRRRRWDRALSLASGRAASVAVDAALIPLGTARQQSDVARWQAEALLSVDAAGEARELVRAAPESGRAGTHGEVASLVRILGTETSALLELGRAWARVGSSGPAELGPFPEDIPTPAQAAFAAHGAADGAAAVAASEDAGLVSDERWPRTLAGLELALAREARTAFADPLARSLDPGWRAEGMLEQLRVGAATAERLPRPAARAQARAALLAQVREGRARALAVLETAGGPAELREATTEAPMAVAIAHDRVRENVRRAKRGQDAEPRVDQSMPEFVYAITMLTSLLVMVPAGFLGIAFSEGLRRAGIELLGPRNGPWAGALLGALLAVATVAIVWAVFTWREGGRLADRELLARRRDEIAALGQRLGRWGLSADDVELAALPTPASPQPGERGEAEGLERLAAWFGLEQVHLLRRVAALDHLPGADLVGEEPGAELSEVRDRLDILEEIAEARLGLRLRQGVAARS
ncbi:MAG: hypothetical protein LBE25_05460 [Arthrobacter sp.]|nr:hypothetical protein [Arthrobacter sp.]